MPLRLYSHHRTDDTGIVLVLVALLMVGLLLFVAFAVDFGGVTNQRRDDQNAADAGVLGGAQDLPSLMTARDRVVTLVNDTLRLTPPLTLTDFNTCSTDTGTLPVPAPNANCISFDSSFTKVRVRLPVILYRTAFARVAGINSFKTTAIAQAEKLRMGFGGVLPFSLYAGAGGDNGEVCLKTGPEGVSPAYPPCNGPETGNFGMLDIRQYGNTGIPTTRRCGNQQLNERFSNNVALGIDHELSVFTGTEILDECGNPGPNTLEVLTGNRIDAFHDGMLNWNTQADDGGAGRLRRGSHATASIGGRNVDDQPLWDFLPDTLPQDTPTSCAKSRFTAALSDPITPDDAQLRDLLHTCFSDYNAGVGCMSAPCTGVLFSRNSTSESPVDLYDIQLSPRFAYVPQLLEAGPPRGSGNVHVAGFRAVFFQRLFGNCSAGTCTIDFEPGVGDSPQGASNEKVNAITGMVFNPNMLPGTLGSEPFQLGSNIIVRLVR